MSPITKIILIASMLYFLFGFAITSNAQETECNGSDYISIDEYGRFVLCWKKNADHNTDGYRVHITQTSGEKGALFHTMLQTECDEYICESPPAVIQTGLGTYYFKVYAYDNMDRESGPSNEVSLTLLNNPPSSPADYIIHTNEGQS